MKHNGYVVVGLRRSIDGTVMKPRVDLCLVSATTGRLLKHMELLQHALRRGSEQYSTKTMFQVVTVGRAKELSTNSMARASLKQRASSCLATHDA